MSDDEYYSVVADDTLRSTDRAILVYVNDNDEVLAYEEQQEIWIPLSQIVDSSDVNDVGDSGELHVTMWFAKERGWI
jgi:chaperone required for assembly of F1-ATPase